MANQEELYPAYDETEDDGPYFFKGAIFSLIFCLPFWAIIFWLCF